MQCIYHLNGLKGVLLLRESPCRGSCGLNPPPAKPSRSSSAITNVSNAPPTHTSKRPSKSTLQRGNLEGRARGVHADAVQEDTYSYCGKLNYVSSSSGQ